MPQDRHAPQDLHVSDIAAALQMSIGLFVRQLRQIRVEGDLSLPEASALRRLERAGPTTVTELAKAEHISVQSIGATVGVLEGRGFLERRPDPNDGRRSVLSITEEGVKILSDKRSAKAEQLAKALEAGFTPEELRQLMVAAPLIERLAQSL
jgi:DNA-binding MarR family transcriptional regulator